MDMGNQESLMVDKYDGFKRIGKFCSCFPLYNQRRLHYDACLSRFGLAYGIDAPVSANCR